MWLEGHTVPLLLLLHVTRFINMHASLRVTGILNTRIGYITKHASIETRTTQAPLLLKSTYSGEGKEAVL